MNQRNHPNINNNTTNAINTTYYYQIHVTKTINQLKQAHLHLLKTRTKPNKILPVLLTRLFHLPGYDPIYARHLVDQIPINNEKTEFLYSSLLRYHAKNAHFSESILVFTKMHRMDVPFSEFSFSSILNSCARIPSILEGKQVHKRLLQSGFLRNKFVKTALLDMYAKCGHVEDARKVFNTMDNVDRDVVSCTAMICGYTKAKMMEEAHGVFEILGEERNVISWTSMVAGYANCGDMRAARELYDKMVVKNSVTWVAMIAGYSKIGEVREAKKVFDEIVERDASCWAAMVVCYSQNGFYLEAIDLYERMRKQNVAITKVAMVAAISACTQLGDVELAATLVSHVDEVCCERTLFVSNALIHMQAKCGFVEEAMREFSRMKERDVISYTTMIMALADHGKSQEALDLFMSMQKERVKPNQVTFIGVLNACSHGGLIKEGLRHFELMTQEFKLNPLTEHITCLVDLLGRAGHVQRAYNLIIEYSDCCDQDDGVWGALLGACKVHGDIELGEIAMKRLSKSETNCSGNYVVLANMYASKKDWSEAERVRKELRGKRMRKSPGCSWILG